MEIVLTDYDDGYERMLMVNTDYYPIEKIQHNITKILSCCYSGCYSTLYTELLKTLEILKICPDNYYTLTIVEDAYISRIYYYSPYRKEHSPTRFDVIKPNFSIFDQDLVNKEVKNG